MRNIIYLTHLCFILISCGSDTAKLKRVEADAIELKYEQDKLDFDKKRSAIIKDLNSRYQVKYMWDSLRGEYSLDYTDVLATKYQLISSYNLQDIYEKDGLKYICIENYPFTFDLAINNEQEVLCRNIDYKHILIVQVNYIKKLKFEISAETDDYSETPSSYIAMQNSDIFWGIGKLIDIKSIKRVKRK